MTALFNRFFELSLIAESGDLLVFSDNKVEFETVLSIGQTPNHCNIRIMNLSDATVNRIKLGEFALIKIIAGYDNTQGTIFFGSIKYARSGRLDSANTFLDILASDGDVWYNWAFLNQTLAENYTIGSSIDSAVTGAQFAQPKYDNAKARQLLLNAVKRSDNWLTGLNLPQNLAPRGKVLYGSARDYFRKMGQNYSFNWSIQQQEISLIPFSASASGEVVEINSQTGLIGYPRVEIDGIHLRVLLNPSIFPGLVIRLNNASITGFLGSPNIRTGEQQTALGARTAEDGLYKVWLATHVGDTRGSNWYTNIIAYDWKDAPRVRNTNLQIQGSPGVYNNPASQ